MVSNHSLGKVNHSVPDVAKGLIQLVTFVQLNQQCVTNVTRRVTTADSVSRKQLATHLAPRENCRSMQPSYIGTLGTGKQAVWTVDVTVKDKLVRFKVDTGAEVTAISEETYCSLGKTPLGKSTRVIYGPARQKLDVLGQVKMQVSYKDCTSTQTLFVIRNLSQNQPIYLVSPLSKPSRSYSDWMLLKLRNRASGSSFRNCSQGSGTLGRTMTSRSRRMQYHTVCSHPDMSHFPCVRKSKSNWTRWKRWTSYQRLMGPRIGALEWWLCRKSQETPESVLTSRHSTITLCVRCIPFPQSRRHWPKSLVQPSSPS